MSTVGAPISRLCIGCEFACPRPVVSLTVTKLCSLTSVVDSSGGMLPSSRGFWWLFSPYPPPDVNRVLCNQRDVRCGTYGEPWAIHYPSTGAVGVIPENRDAVTMTYFYSDKNCPDRSPTSCLMSSSQTCLRNRNRVTERSRVQHSNEYPC